MAGDWPTVPLDELVDDILDRRGVTPLKLGSDFVASGYRVISARAIKGRRVDLTADEPRFVNELTYRKWMKTPLLADDVILTSEAPLGEPAYVSRDVEWCLGQRLFSIRTKKTLLKGRFLFYALQSEQVRHDLLSRATGTTAQGVRQTELRRVNIPLPSMEKQRAIAHILGSLDDKIDLNRRMCETLEATARALFKSWFVDFDRVRAKAEGRHPSVPQQVTEILSAGITDADGGEIPEGWAAGRLIEMVDQLRENENPMDSPDAEFVHFSLPAFDNGQRPARERGAAIKSQKSRVVSGSVLLSKLNPEIERVWLVDIQKTDRAVSSTEFLVLKPRAPFSRAYLYCYLRSPLFRQQIEGLVTGTSKSHQRAHVSSILKLRFIRAPLAVLEAFDGIVEPILQRTLSSRREIQTLAELRDSLLPQLISGDLRIKDAEKFAS